MLAQNFMTAADLGISDDELSALIKVLGMLERGELKYADASIYVGVDGLPRIPDGFNMNIWASKEECGTVCCIGGTVDCLMGRRVDIGIGFTAEDLLQAGKPGLDDLFYPDILDRNAITPSQAASALRNFLTTGEARWSEAMAA